MIRRAVDALRASTLAGRAWAVLRIAGWATILHAADRPWRELGGVLGERMRWLERVALGTALVVGWVAGLPPLDSGQRRACLASRGFIVPAGLVAAVLVGLEIQGRWEWILMLVVGWLAYWAGLDLACSAWPRLRAPRDDSEAGES